MADGEKLSLAVGKRDDDLLVRELDDVRRLERGRLDADQFVKKYPSVRIASAFCHERDSDALCRWSLAQPRNGRRSRKIVYKKSVLHSTVIPHAVGLHLAVCSLVCRPRRRVLRETTDARPVW
jgi:hypothetical protein